MSTAQSYGLLAEFTTAQSLLEATQKVTEAGYTKTDAFSPFPVHGLFDALRIKEHKVQPIILVGGLLGLATAVALEYYSMVVWYPMNIGGRPLWAWVAYIPPAFELTILFAAFSAVIGMFALNGLPRPHHPVFNWARFAEHASSDSFFLVIEASDPKFDPSRTRVFLSGLGAREVVAVDE